MIKPFLSFSEQVMSLLPAAVYFCDAEGLITSFNQQAVELWGGEPDPGDRFCGCHGVYRIDGTPIGSKDSPMATALREGRAIRGAKILVERPDGRLIYLSANVDVMRDDGGSIVGATSVLLDITATNRAEKLAAAQHRALVLLAAGAALEKVLTELISAVEQETIGRALAAIMLVGADGHSLRHGAALGLPRAYQQAIDGITLNSTIGTCSAAAAQNEVIITTDIENDPAWRGIEKLALEFGLRAAWSMPIRASDGKVLGTFGTYFRERRAPTTEEREMVAVLAKTAAVVIEQRRTEEELRRFRHFAQSSGEFAAMCDLEGTLVFVNASGRDMTGLTASHPAPPLRLRDLIWPDDQTLVFETFLPQVLREGHGSAEIRFRHLHSGKPLWMCFNLTASRDESGRAIGFATVSQNVTERKAIDGDTALLAALSESILFLSDPAEIALTTTRMIGEYLESNHCYLCEWDAHLGRAIVNYDWQSDDAPSFTGAHDLSTYGPTDWWTFLTVGNVCIEDVTTHRLAANFLPAYEALRIRSFATARFKRDAPETITLVATVAKCRVWQARELSLLENAIARVWPAIERAREQQHDAVVAHLSQQISTLAASEEITRTAIECVGQHLCAQRCYFFTAADDPDRILVTENWYRPGLTSLSGEYDISAFASSARWDLIQTERVTVDDVRLDAQLNSEQIESLAIRSLATVPFIRDGRWVAGLAVTSKEPRRWSESELAFVENVIARVWPVVERARATAALEQSAERLNLAISAANLGYFSWDATSDLLVFSAHGAEIFGVAGRTSLTRTELRELLHEEDRERAHVANDRALASRTDYDIEYRMKPPSGDWRWIAAKGRGVYNAQGLPVGMQGVVQDITGRKSAEKKLRAQEAELRAHADELEQRVEARTASLREAIVQMEEFSYSVSHDLRAPLRAMNAYAQVLLEDHSEQLDPTAKNYLERIQRSSLRMEKLTHDVLTYSRIARLDLQLTTIDLNRLLADVIHQYVELQPPQATVEVEKPLHAVLGHETSLGQAVANLMTNAVKFVAHGVHPTIRVEAEMVGERVRLRIVDNGIGIKPEHQTRLFQIFERLPTQVDYEGTGIGLAIVRKAMEKMGGQFGIESDGKNGSLFWIELDRA